MKMNVRLFAVATTLTFSSFSFAQDSRVQDPGVQLRIGLNMANVSVTDDGRVDKADMLTSFHAGIVGDIPLGSVISFQPGVFFTGKGSKLEKGDPSSSTYFKETFNPYYIEIPANLVLKAPLGSTTHFFIGAGPYLGVGIGGKTKLEGKLAGFSINGEKSIEYSNDDPTTTNEEEGAGFGKLKRFDYGLNGTAGIEGKTIVLSAGYGYGLAKLPSGSNSNADDNNKHRVLSFTVGFKL
jgi:hypothetical protein